MLETNEPELNLFMLQERVHLGANSVLDELATNNIAEPETLEPDNWQDRKLNLEPPFQPKSDDHYHVHDLLQYHDRYFIQNAYRAILKRSPDSTGFESFASRLRSGDLNKIDILARLRYSSEGRSKKVKIDGLLVPAVIRRSYRVPVIGYLLQLIIAIGRLPASVRSSQQFEAHEMAQKLQMVDFLNELEERQNARARIQEEHLSSLSGELDSLRDLTGTALEEINKNAVELIAQQQRRIEESAEDLRRLIENSSAQLEQKVAGALANEKSHIENELRRIRIAQQAETSETVAREKALREELQVRINALRQNIELRISDESAARREIQAALSIQGLMLDRALSRVTAAGPTTPGVSQKRGQEAVEEDRHSLDALYTSLEARFRGRREEVQKRLRYYLPLLRDSGVGSEDSTLVDLGSGHGEWLELLRSEGVKARGADRNLAAVAECRRIGLEVSEGDVVDALSSLPELSIGAVTGFHIVEHLELEKVIRLIDESLRVLKPGGLLIFETPNPENVLVGSCNFYFDPTHRNPIPPPLLKFFLESRGFERVEVVRLNPSNAIPVEGDSDLVRRFNQFFYGPMDYAVIGRKGGA
jgi:SAM-dependent methyltransferase